MNDLPKLENALTVVMSRGELEDFAAENFSVRSSDILKSESASEIPGVSLILSLLRDGVAVRDYIFQKKLFGFLSSMKSMPKKERGAMIAKLENDRDYGRKFGQHLIELIDRIEAHMKPRMVARVFRAFHANEIDATMLHRLLHAVERLPAFDIPLLRPFCEADPTKRIATEGMAQNFSVAGLVSGTSSWGGMVYKPTSIAEVFLRLELDRQE